MLRDIVGVDACGINAPTLRKLHGQGGDRLDFLANVGSDKGI